MLGLGLATFIAAAPAAPVFAAPTSAKVSVDLINGIAIRILDKTGASSISSIDLALAATPTGSFLSDSFIAEVDSSNITGYKLYMTSNYEDPSSTAETPVYTNALVNSESAEHSIPTLATDVTKSDFTAGGTNTTNRWGYSLDDTTYTAIPEHAVFDEIKSTSDTSAHDQTPVYVAMNVNLAKASGAYHNSLVFSVIANPIPTDYTLSFNLNGGSAPSGSPNAFDDMTSKEVAASKTFTIPSVTPVLTGYNFTYWTDSSGTHYNPGDTITIIGDEEYVGEETLTANWSLASYTINITNSNTTSGSASISVPYGGSNTITVTPSSGYYLSNVSCPAGYTCSGYSTGTSYTGQQTVTVTNNNTTSGGTLGFTGTVSGPIGQCATTAQHGTYTHGGIQYIKLKDNKCYTKSSQGSATWANAAAKCPSGTHLPTAQEFDSLLTAYGGSANTGYGSPYGWYDGDADLYNATGWSGVYWSATEYASNTSYAWYLGVNSSYSGVSNGNKTNSRNVVCMAG